MRQTAVGADIFFPFFLCAKKRDLIPSSPYAGTVSLLLFFFFFSSLLLVLYGIGTAYATSSAAPASGSTSTDTQGTPPFSFSPLPSSRALRDLEKSTVLSRFSVER